MTEIVRHLIGAWSLVSQHTEYPDGRRHTTRGNHPVGLLMYDADGNMSVQLMRVDERAEEYTDLTQLKTAIGEYHAYFGRYEVDEAAGIVRHFVTGAAYPPYRDTVQIRYFSLSEDNTLLTLTVYADDGTRRIIVWRKKEAQLTAQAEQPS